MDIHIRLSALSTVARAKLYSNIAVNVTLLRKYRPDYRCLYIRLTLKQNEYVSVIMSCGAGSLDHSLQVQETTDV